MPTVGPILAAVPAILAALPMGLTSVLLVIGYTSLLQALENNVLIPRIMSHAVGISPLMGLFALLAFTLYGVLGVFVAIPLTVVIQVLVDHLVVNVEPVLEPTGLTATPLAKLRQRLQTLRQQVRVRLRGRESRIGRGAPKPDRVADAVDQHIEQTVERADAIIVTAQEEAELIQPEVKETIAEELDQTIQAIAQAVEQVDSVIPTTQSGKESTGAGIEAEVLEDLAQAMQQAEEVVPRAETAIKGIHDDLDSKQNKAAPRSKVLIVEE